MFDYNNSQLEINLPQERPALESELAVMSPLGNTYEIGIRANSSRILRYILKEISADITEDSRVAACNRAIIPNHNEVPVKYNPARARAYYGNILQCGSIWFCPVCACKIIYKRKPILQRGIAAYKESGGFAYMLTVTNQHSKDDSLALVYNVLAESIKSVLTCRFWRDAKVDYQVEGSIGALEIRYGNVNGWHPHRHYLFLCKQALSKNDLAELESELSDRYIAELEKRGSTGIKGIALVLTDDTQNGGYLQKWGLDSELTAGELKLSKNDSRTPFGLLAGVMAGSKEDSRLYLEYYKTVKGLRALVMHKGCKTLLNSAILKTDQELVEESQPDSIILAVIARNLWNIICARRLQAQLLDIADSGDELAVNSYLWRLIKENNL